MLSSLTGGSLAILSFFIASLFPLCSCLLYNSTALLIAIDDQALWEGKYLLDGYGMIYDTLIVPETGTDLPPLETSEGGNYGLFIIVAQAMYNGISAITNNQYNALYAYQIKYGVRMVNVDVFPTPGFGAETVAGCCLDGSEQNVTLLPNAQADFFPTAGLRITDLGTVGLYHYAASIIPENASTTVPFMIFKPNIQIANTTIAGVINTFPDGREQMALFVESGNWSSTSTYFNHAWLTWGYRGLFQGFRRIYLQTQVDDLFLQTAMYVTNDIFRLRKDDLYEHVQWTSNVNQRLNSGSSYFTEFGFNANGNLIYDYTVSENGTSDITCQAAVFTDWNEPSTLLEYVKPLGTGVDKWPLHPTFDWTAQCLFLDPLAQFFANTTNRDAVGLVSHTFTHLELDNATYHDALREIQFNLMYAEFLNFTNAAKFSGSGLIPPAITGLHNGDVIRAWADNGLWNAIGDNTRPILRNPNSYHWPLITGVPDNGFDGYQITPRFATRIYYNCAEVDCDVQQWVDTEGGVVGGNITTLLDTEKATVSNQLLSLFHDPYMFHQPNLRQIDVSPTLVNGKMQKLSLLQMWVETIVVEVMRLVEWPMITLKHDHIAMAFNQRMTLDACTPYIQFSTKPISIRENSTQAITGFTVRTETNNTCEVPIPVTLPGELVDTKGFRVEQIGSDPATIWVNLDGDSQSFVLRTPIPI